MDKTDLFQMLRATAATNHGAVPISAKDPMTKAINDCKRCLADLRRDLQLLDGVLLGQGHVVMNGLFAVRFDISGNDASNPRSEGGSAYRAQRFSKDNATRLASTVRNGHGEAAEAMPLGMALQRQITAQVELLAFLTKARP